MEISVKNYNQYVQKIADAEKELSDFWEYIRNSSIKKSWDEWRILSKERRRLEDIIINNKAIAVRILVCLQSNKKWEDILGHSFPNSPYADLEKLNEE